MTASNDVTLVKGAIHNPDEPRHFMRVVSAPGRRTATVDGTVIADSTTAVLVKEVGRDIYDPVVYFPRADVEMGLLARIDKSTHCPLKGDTEYFDLSLGGRTVAEVAWSYVDMVDVDGVEVLQGLVAFDTGLVDLD